MLKFLKHRLISPGCVLSSMIDTMETPVIRIIINTVIITNTGVISFSLDKANRPIINTGLLYIYLKHKSKTYRCHESLFYFSAPASYTSLPSNIVADTASSATFSISTSNIFLSRTSISAFLPTSMLPVSFSI